LTHRPTNDRASRARIWSLAVLNPESRWFPAFWLSLATAISFVLRLPLFGLPMIADEGGYAYVAQRWLDGRGTLYSDLWVSRPQGIFLAYGAIFHTIGTSAEALRIGAWLVSVATMGVVWIFAARWSNRSTAALAVVLFAFLSGSPAIEGFTANAEVFMALPSAIGILALLRSFDLNWSRRWLTLAGIMTGVATLMKPSGIVILLVGAAFVGLASAGGTRAVLGRWGWLIFGFIAALAPALIQGYLVGWDNFIFASVTYRMFHQSGMQKGPMHQVTAVLNMAARGWPVMALGLFPPVLILLRQGVAITVGAWVDRITETSRAGIVARRIERPLRPAGGEIDLMLRLWLIACLAGISIGGDWWNHYLIQILAPLSIWVAAHTLDARRWLSGRGNFAVAITLALLVLVPYREAIGKSATQASQDIFYHSGYADQEAVADYIKAHSPQDAQIWAAFNEPELYYLADRASPYRYLYSQELLAIPDSERQLVTILSSPRRPMYLIGTKQGAPYPDRGQAFWNSVAAHYHLETIVNGVPIFRANQNSEYIQLSPSVG
jgi:4-amino-4-deoxy-L-arabinose transferase-like glycosyltransferase